MFERPWRSFDSAHCCSEDISRILKGSSNHLDERILVPKLRKWDLSPTCTLAFETCQYWSSLALQNLLDPKLFIFYFPCKVMCLLWICHITSHIRIMLFDSGNGPAQNVVWLNKYNATSLLAIGLCSQHLACKNKASPNNKLCLIGQ